MRLWNKLLVREAQAPIFSESQITGEEPVKKELPQPVQATTAFRRGLQNLKTKLASNRPANLPEDIIMPIVQAAEEVKAA